jgi:hypothetical protein
MAIKIRVLFWAASFAAFFGGLSLPAIAQGNGQVHGMWVWKGPSVVAAPQGAEMLRDFCRSEGINEIYISISHSDRSADEQFARMIGLMHRSNIRVEALLSSTDADEQGVHREKLLDHVREIVAFNRAHSGSRFDGVHLDIEPQQRPENKGPGNLGFLPNLVSAYREVCALAEPAQLTVNADIQNKLLKGDLEQRRMLLSSVSRVTLMLYELSSPNDGDTTEQKIEKLRTASQRFLDMAYEGLHDPNLARMVIGLRTPDYGSLMPTMLKSLDEVNGGDRNYHGWAWHAYADASQATH